MKSRIRLNGFNRECETEENLEQLRRKLLDLNDGNDVIITFKLKGKQRVGMSECGLKFAENLVEGLR